MDQKVPEEPEGTILMSDIKLKYKWYNTIQLELLKVFLFHNLFCQYTNNNLTRTDNDMTHISVQLGLLSK